MRLPVIIDGRSLCHLKEIETAGFAYYSVGRAPAVAVDHVGAIPKPASGQIRPLTSPAVNEPAILMGGRP
jgi:hypothetical protein